MLIRRPALMLITWLFYYFFCCSHPTAFLPANTWNVQIIRALHLCFESINILILSISVSLLVSLCASWWLCLYTCVFCRRCGRVGVSCSPIWSRRTPFWTSWNRSWTRRKTSKGERRSCRRLWMWVWRGGGGEGARSYVGCQEKQSIY